jgi:hypothetical protein
MASSNVPTWLQGSQKPGIPKGYGMYNLPTMGGGQEDIYNMLKGQFQGGGGDVYNKLLSMAQGQPGAFEQMEAPALAQFQQQIAPGIAQRYAGSGIGASSGMQNSLAGAGGNLAQNLQSQRMGLMQQSMHDVMGLGNMLLGTPTQQFGLYQKENIFRDLMQLLGGASSQALGIWGGSKLAGLGTPTKQSGLGE